LKVTQIIPTKTFLITPPETEFEKKFQPNLNLPEEWLISVGWVMNSLL